MLVCRWAAGTGCLRGTPPARVSTASIERFTFAGEALFFCVLRRRVEMPTGRHLSAAFRASLGRTPVPGALAPQRIFQRLTIPKLSTGFVRRCARPRVFLDIRQKRLDPSVQPSFVVWLPNRVQLARLPRPNATKPVSFCCVRSVFGCKTANSGYILPFCVL